MAQNIPNMPHTASGSGRKGITGGTRTLWRAPRHCARTAHVLTYINNINRGISGTIKLFADDALLFHQIRSDADCVSLQNDLDTLNSWSRRWRMQFNASKCHVLQVTKKKSIITHEYSLGQEKLSVVPSHPYLGIEIDNKLSWKQQIEKTKHKSIRTLNMVRRNFTKGTTQIRNQIFTGLVRLTLE